MIQRYSGRRRFESQGLLTRTLTKRLPGLVTMSVTVTRSKLESMAVTLSVAEAFGAHDPGDKSLLNSTEYVIPGDEDALRRI